MQEQEKQYDGLSKLNAERAIDRPVVGVDVIMEGVRLLLSETRGGARSGTVQITGIEGYIGNNLEDLAREGQLKNWTKILLNTCIYPTTREEIPAYRKLKELFENHIIKSKLGTRKQFGTSSLGKLFSELGV